MLLQSPYFFDNICLRHLIRLTGYHPSEQAILCPLGWYAQQQTIMKTTIRTTVPLLAQLLLGLQNRQQLATHPHRASMTTVHLGGIRPILIEEAPMEIRSFWQRDAYSR